MPHILATLALLAVTLSASAAAAAPNPAIYDNLVARCSSARLVDCTAAFEASIKDLGASNLGPMDLDATLGLIAAAAGGGAAGIIGGVLLGGLLGGAVGDALAVNGQQNLLARLQAG